MQTRSWGSAQTFSALFGGQTLGKRLLGVRAVGRAGALMTLPASLLRYSVLGVPFFLNGAPFDTKVLLSPVGYVLSLVVFGGILSIPYLYLFNRRGRRSLHDLAVGSSVVTAATPVALVAPAPVWRGHLLVVGVILIAAAVLPAFTRRLAQGETFQGTMAAYEAVTAEPGVQNALVTHGTAFRSGQANVDSVGAQVRLKERRLDDAALAEHFARVILNHDKQASRVSVINITVVYGFDVGIASGWRSKSYQFLPETLTAGGGRPAGSSK